MSHHLSHQVSLHRSTPQGDPNLPLNFRADSIVMNHTPSTGFLLAAALLLLGSSASAHHFKGLPHYNYFENYPQIPEEEFIGQADPYAFSLVLYDFQGIERDNVKDPDNVRLFLVAFNLFDNIVYNGPATLEVLDRGKVLHVEKFESSAEESLYAMYRELPNTGKYALRITLHNQDNLQCLIPFKLSSQKVYWGKWIGGGLLLLVIVAAIGARKARVKMDRKDEARRRPASQSKASV
jgi:hypothetical protein